MLKSKNSSRSVVTGICAALSIATLAVLSVATTFSYGFDRGTEEPTWFDKPPIDYKQPKNCPSACNPPATVSCQNLQIADCDAAGKCVCITP